MGDFLARPVGSDQHDSSIIAARHEFPASHCGRKNRAIRMHWNPLLGADFGKQNIAVAEGENRHTAEKGRRRDKRPGFEWGNVVGEGGGRVCHDLFHYEKCWGVRPSPACGKRWPLRQQGSDEGPRRHRDLDISKNPKHHFRKVAAGFRRKMMRKQ
jgi:hypothetical protein